MEFLLLRDDACDGWWSFHIESYKLTIIQCSIASYWHVRAILSAFTLVQCSHWWRHEMENIFRVTGPLCGEFTGPGPPHKGQWRGAFNVFFDLGLNKRLSKQPRCWWFETPLWSLWRQCNDFRENWSCRTSLVGCGTAVWVVNVSLHQHIYLGPFLANMDWL